MNICVYGASSRDLEEGYIRDGEKLGEILAERGHSLVFGGGNSGLMGAVARGAYKKSGVIISVAPDFFQVDGVLFPHYTEFYHTSTMRERKERMENLSDAFVMTPGGIGTFEEFFEMLTAKQLCLHNKPLAVLNTNGYFNPMLSMLNRTVSEKFMHKKSLSLFSVLDTPKDVIDFLEKDLVRAQNEELPSADEFKNILLK